MTQKITIAGIKGSTANKQGQPYLDKDGRAKTRVTITCDGLPNGKKEMSTFAYQDSPVMKWQMGESHEVDITLSPDGKYVNFFPARSEMDAVNRPATTMRTGGSPGYAESAPAQNPMIPNGGTIQIPGFTEADRREMKNQTILLEKIYTYLNGGEPQ